MHRIEELAVGSVSLLQMKGSIVFAAHCVAMLGLVWTLEHGAAAASSRGVEAAFGNTIRSTYPDGRQAELWLSPDGDYRANGRRGDASSGVWRIRGSQLCLRQRRPLSVPFSYCTRIPRSLDVVWVACAVTGETIQVALVRGHSIGRKGPPR